MNRLTIIGNLTGDPELRTTQTGKEVCNFSVAVNRKIGQEQKTDYFRVNAWGEMGKNCNKYLAKGRKVAVVGAVSIHEYTTQNGEYRANMEVLASDVEFLTPREQTSGQAAQEPQGGYMQPQGLPDRQEPRFTQVDMDDELPF